MEKRETKIMFAKSGGGSRTTRITLPVTWIDKLGITPEDREVIIKIEDNKIIIEKK